MTTVNEFSALELSDLAITQIHRAPEKKLNLIWIEAANCTGNLISLLNGNNPNILYLMNEMVNFRFNNSLMSLEGEAAYEVFLNTLNTDFILAVDGAIATRDNGDYCIMANYKGKAITVTDAIKMAADKAKYIISVGTCSCFGGIAAAAPNPSLCVSLDNFLNKSVIKLPGCPCHPDWFLGTIAHIILYGKPLLDAKDRPIMFYGTTIHDNCTRRSYFDKGIFAKKIGDSECLFKLGCRGPVTRTDCPVRKWNGYVNWPVGDNTPCIGCANEYFPDRMEPFIKND